MFFFLPLANKLFSKTPSWKYQPYLYPDIECIILFFILEGRCRLLFCENYHSNLASLYLCRWICCLMWKSEKCVACNSYAVGLKTVITDKWKQWKAVVYFSFRVSRYYFLIETRVVFCWQGRRDVESCAIHVFKDLRMDQTAFPDSYVEALTPCRLTPFGERALGSD